MGPAPHRRVGLVIAVVSWVVILGLTLFPTPDQAPTAADTSVWCLVCGSLGVVDVLLNVVLFLPLGIGLGLWRPGLVRALLLIGLTTLTIEVLQLSLIPGRDASLSDLLTNSVGGVIGYLAANRLRAVIFPRPETCFLLAVLGMGAWLLLQAFSAWAVKPTFPSSVYFGQWAPELGQFDHFTGTVRSVTLNGIPVPGWRLANSTRIRQELQGPATIEVETETGERTRRTAPVFSVFDEQQRMILLVGVRGDGFVFQLRTHLDRLRLRSPLYFLPDARAAAIGTPMTIRASHLPGSYFLQVSYPDGSGDSRLIPVSPSWSWSFALPFGYALGPEARWLTAIWVGLLWAPIAYWAARARRKGPGLWWGLFGLTLVLGLAGVPIQLHLSVAALPEWIGGLLGMAAGWTLGNLGSPLAGGQEQMVGLAM